jgi:hypothetical protein
MSGFSNWRGKAFRHFSGIFVIIVLAATTSTFAVRAQVIITNAPKTKLEAFEVQTGKVIVMGEADIGSIAAKTGTVSVRAKETTDSGTGQKEYGIEIKVSSGDQLQDSTVIDYDELDSVLGGIDYLSKVDWTVTPLPSFDAVYATKGDFRFAVYGSKRTGTVQAAVSSNHLIKSKALLTMDQLSQLRVLITQAKTTLDSIRSTK